MVEIFNMLLVRQKGGGNTAAKGQSGPQRSQVTEVYEGREESRKIVSKLSRSASTLVERLRQIATLSGRSKTGKQRRKMMSEDD